MGEGRTSGGLPVSGVLGQRLRFVGGETRPVLVAPTGNDGKLTTKGFTLGPGARKHCRWGDGGGQGAHVWGGERRSRQCAPGRQTTPATTPKTGAGKDARGADPMPLERKKESETEREREKESEREERERERERERGGCHFQYLFTTGDLRQQPDVP